VKRAVEIVKEIGYDCLTLKRNLPMGKEL